MDDFRHIIPFFVPIIAIVMGIAVGMLGLWLDFQKKTRMFELHHKERLLAIERGMEVPPLPAEFFSNGRKSQTDARSSSLRWGLVWLLLGLAFAVALLLNDGPEAASWALLPIAVGIAQILYYKLDKPSVDPAAGK
jgi:hypothetical protein